MSSRSAATPAALPLLGFTVVIALALAAMTAAGATWMDAGVRAASAFALDGSHAPGHALLGKLASLVPIGEVGFRIAVLSAASMAVAIAGTYALARALVPSERVAAIAASGLTALSPVVQQGGTEAEVHGPTAALLVWAMVHVVRYVRPGDETDDPRDPRLAALFVGIAASMQPVIAGAAAVPMAMAIARRSSWRRGLTILVCGALPLLAYLYVLARGAPDSSIDAVSWVGEGAAARFAGLALMCGEGLALGVLLGGVIGLVFGAISGLRGAGVVLAAMVAVLAAAAALGEVHGSVAGRVAPAVFFLAAGIAPAIGAIMRTLPGELVGRNRILAASAMVLPIVAIGLAGSVVAVRDSGFRRGDGPTRWIDRTVGDAPAGPTIFVAAGEHTSHVWRYEREVAGLRPDVRVITPSTGGADGAIDAAIAKGHAVAGEAPRADAIPRGYAFEYAAGAIGEAPRAPIPELSGDIGRRVQGLARLHRGRYLAARGNLREAFAAAGIIDVFSADELARLEQAAPARTRSSWLPHLPKRTHVFVWEPWQTLLWADDVAWTSGLDRDEMPMPSVYERRVQWWWSRAERGLELPDARSSGGFAPPPRPAK